MRKQSILANLLLLLGTASSNLDWIAGYDPLTYVVDHAAIDLDQREIEKWLDVGIFQQAEKIYTKGGHSQSFARLRLLNAAPPAAPFPPGTLVYGLGVNGDGVQGRLLHTTTWINGDEAIIDVEYDREKILDRPSYCQVGALALTDSALKNGCEWVESIRI